MNIVELLIINKDIDIVNNILQNNIDRGDLSKSQKQGEVFFTYLDLIRKDKITKDYIILNNIFKCKSKYIREINFYDFNNEASISSGKPQPLSPELPVVPNIIKNVFGNDAIVITYLDSVNADVLSIERGLKSCSPDSTDDYHKIANIYNGIDELNTLSKNELFKNHNIGFLLLTNNPEYNLKQNIELFYDEPNPDTKFILLYKIFNKGTDEDNLTNILINTNKYYLELSELYDNNKIRKIIIDDYPEIHEMFNN